MDRRRVLGGTPWSPEIARPIAWYYAAGQYVSLNGAGVVNWNDKLAGGNDVIQATSIFQPTWESVNGWSSTESSIRAISQPLNSAGSGAAPIEAAFSGTGKPFSVLVTCQVLLAGTQNVCKWTGSGGVLQSCTINGSGFLGMTRSDGVTTETATATVSPVGSGHLRLAFTFDGSTGSGYVEGLRAFNTILANPGTMALTQFTLGDVRDLRYTEVIAIPRGLSAAEVALYNAYSLNEWGA